LYSYCIALRGVALLLSGCIQYSTSVAGGKTRNENVYSIPNNGLAWIRCACVCASQQTVQRSTESPSRCVKPGDKLQSASNVELGCSVIDLLCREDGNDATARSALRRSQDQILGWPVCTLRLLSYFAGLDTATLWQWCWVMRHESLLCLSLHPEHRPAMLEVNGAKGMAACSCHTFRILAILWL
jgi:hypothetical protein